MGVGRPPHTFVPIAVALGSDTPTSKMLKMWCVGTAGKTVSAIGNLNGKFRVYLQVWFDPGTLNNFRSLPLVSPFLLDGFSPHQSPLWWPRNPRFSPVAQWAPLPIPYHSSQCLQAASDWLSLDHLLHLKPTCQGMAGSEEQNLGHMAP